MDDIPIAVEMCALQYLKTICSKDIISEMRDAREMFQNLEVWVCDLFTDIYTDK